MKILFFALHWGYVRPYASVLEELADRGHRIHVAADIEETFGNRPLVERLSDEHQGITFGWTPERPETLLRRFKRDLRHGINFLRYQEPMYLEATALKDSGAYRTPRFIRWLSERVSRRPLERFLRLLERALPLERGLIDYLRSEDPDMVLVSPLLGISEDQFDELRAAKRLGIPSVYCVASWDNLSSMAYIRFVPDRVMVWNETQKREATEMHGVPAERVIVTGAQGFDKWFDRRPSRSPRRFRDRVGLPADRPYLLYMCSCLMPGSPSEAEFVLEWCRALRDSDDPELARAAVLVRPHPQRLKQWEGVSLEDFEGVAVWGRNPVDETSQEDYFESMLYAELVVGLSTTAMIEAAALGKPVFTVMLERFRPNQEAMPHFPYLLEVEGGLLYAARDLERHVEQLAERLREPETPDPRSLRFTRAFVRPHGLDVRGTDVFTGELESFGTEASPRPERPRLGPLLARYALLYPLVAAYWTVEATAPTFVRLERWRRDLVRAVTRGARRAAQAPLRLEKSVLPGAYIMVRTYPQLGDSAGARLGELFTWARRGDRGSIRYDDSEGTEVPGAVTRYGLLYPVIGAGKTAAAASRLANAGRRSRDRLLKAWERYRHRRRKRTSLPVRLFHELRSRSRMAVHRGRKRLRSRWQGVVRRLRRVVGS